MDGVAGTRGRAVALALGGVLLVGLATAACNDDKAEPAGQPGSAAAPTPGGQPSGGPRPDTVTGTLVTEPAVRSYADALTAALRTRGDARITRVDVYKDKRGRHDFVIVTDRAGVPESDKTKSLEVEYGLFPLLRAAMIWTADNVFPAELFNLYVTTSDGLTSTVASGPERGDLRAKSKAYADQLLAHLRGTPRGSAVTHVDIERDLDTYTVYLRTTLAPGEGSKPAARELIAAIGSWLTRNPAANVQRYFVLDTGLVALASDYNL